MVKQGGRCRWQVTHMFFIQCLKSRNEVMVGSSSPPVRRRAPHCIEGSGDSRAPRAPLQMFVAGALHQREGAVNFVVEMAAAIPQH